MKRLEIYIYGKVQGIYFRDGARRIAEPRGIKGFAENLSDGSVKIVAEGKEGYLKELLEWSKHGSELAEVEKVDPHWQEATGEFSDFQIK